MYRSDQMVSIVVGVGPGLAASAVALANDVAFVVVLIGPGAVRDHFVVAAHLVAAPLPVAVGLVAVAGAAGVDELVGCVVAVVCDCAVVVLGAQSAASVVGVLV